jgi:hypothetical protein
MYPDHMGEPARQHVPDGDAVPAAVDHEKTVEVPAFSDPVPEPIADRDTLPVRSSLESMLRHEMLRRQTATDKLEP